MVGDPLGTGAIDAYELDRKFGVAPAVGGDPPVVRLVEERLDHVDLGVARGAGGVPGADQPEGLVAASADVRLLGAQLDVAVLERVAVEVGLVVVQRHRGVELVPVVLVVGLERGNLHRAVVLRIPRPGCRRRAAA